MQRAFTPTLSVVRADTEADWQESVAIHTQSYCAERQFESLADHQDPDRFDVLDGEQTRRALVVARDGTALATTRIIMPGPHPLPTCELSSELNAVATSVSPVECSGFCCLKERCRAYGFTRPVDRSHITALLIGAMCAMAQEALAEQAVMTLDPSLKVYLHRRFGTPLRQVGGPVAYHGTRVVCHVPIPEILRCMLQRSPQYYATATNNGALWSLLRSRRVAVEYVAA